MSCKECEDLRGAIGFLQRANDRAESLWEKAATENALLKTALEQIAKGTWNKDGGSRDHREFAREALRRTQ